MKTTSNASAHVLHFLCAWRSSPLKTLVLMARFRRARPHLAVVTDEYGTTLGLVTPADVMGTIAGQLPDDFAAEPRVVRRDRDSWFVGAGIELHDLERAVGAGGLATKYPFMTLAGLLLENPKRIPLVGEVVVVNGWRLEVMEVDNNRIERVLASRLSDTARVLDDAHAFAREGARQAASGREQRPSGEG